MLALWDDDRYAVVETFENSWLFGYGIWRIMSDRYANGMDCSDPKIWDVFNAAKKTECDRAVLRMTYDYAVVEAANFTRMAAHIKEFWDTLNYSEKRTVKHLDQIRRIFECEPVCDYIGFYGTSNIMCLLDPSTKKDKKIPWDKVIRVYNEKQKTETTGSSGQTTRPLQ